MNLFRKALFSGFLVGLMSVVSLGVAHATYYSNTFGVEVWSGPGTTDTANRASQPKKPLFANFLYTGPIDFVNNNGQNGSNTFLDFFGSKTSGISRYSGTVSLSSFLGTTMSTPGFNDNSYLEFLFVYSGSGANVSVTHDDGASLYYTTDHGTVPVFESPSPTSAITTTGFLPGTSTVEFVGLIYVESNGAPAVLTMTMTPEPSTWLLFATGLAGLLYFGRKKLVVMNAASRI